MIANRRMYNVRVGRKGTIVIPAPLRHELGLAEGSTMNASVSEDGTLTLDPVPSDPVERLRKAFGGVFEGVDAVAYVRELRNEWPD
jgi:AbrB family looped-hinge helix DNA binding protein